MGKTRQKPEEGNTKSQGSPQIDQLKMMTTVAVQTSWIDTISQIKPQYVNISSKMIKALGNTFEESAIDFGKTVIPLLGVIGTVSIATDTKLAFDTEGLISQAWNIKARIASPRVLIGIPATWEGIQAAAHLQTKGVLVNLTNVLCKAQAMAAIDAGATRITIHANAVSEWHRENLQRQYLAHEDPGKILAADIYTYIRSSRKFTEVAVIWDTTAAIFELSGINQIVLTPELLKEFEQIDRPGDVLVRKFELFFPMSTTHEKLTEAQFRWEFNENQMAVEVFSAQIRNDNQNNYGCHYGFNSMFFNFSKKEGLKLKVNDQYKQVLQNQKAFISNNLNSTDIHTQLSRHVALPMINSPKETPKKGANGLWPVDNRQFTNALSVKLNKEFGSSPRRPRQGRSMNRNEMLRKVRMPKRTRFVPPVQESYTSREDLEPRQRNPYKSHLRQRSSLPRPLMIPDTCDQDQLPDIRITNLLSPVNYDFNREQLLSLSPEDMPEPQDPRNTLQSFQNGDISPRYNEAPTRQDLDSGGLLSMGRRWSRS